MGVEDLLKDDKGWIKLTEGVIIEQLSCDEIAVIYNPSNKDTNALEEYFDSISQALSGVTLRLLPIHSTTKDERIFLIPINSKDKPIKIKFQ